jgi:D-alanyl-D-alanine carboxypeptidase (penicillin-binding protein 5/6)
MGMSQRILTAVVPAVSLITALSGASLVSPAEARTTEGTPGSPIGGDLLGGRGIIIPIGVKAPPKTKAKSFVIADADTGRVLAAQDPHGRYLPASTLKTLTAVTLIPKLNKNARVRPSRWACDEEGSAVGLVPKPIYRVDDLMRALLMVSGNDAANALAEANGGLAVTLADMNTEARRLQAYDTVAKTPSGLDKPGQSSSAYDLALIARAGLALPAFKQYVSTKTAKFPAPKGYYEIGNHNKLLWRYKGMVGVKNGWTSKALGSFVGAATRGGRTIIVSIMRHDGYFWEDVAGLMDWGFAHQGRVSPVGVLVDPLPAGAALSPVTEAGGSPGGTSTGSSPKASPGAVAPSTPRDGTSPSGGDAAEATNDRTWSTAAIWLLAAALTGGLASVLRRMRRRRPAREGEPGS